MLAEGDRIKVMVLSQDRERGRVALCTKKLEPTPGDMLRDPGERSGPGQAQPPLLPRSAVQPGSWAAEPGRSEPRPLRAQQRALCCLASHASEPP